MSNSSQTGFRSVPGTVTLQSLLALVLSPVKRVAFWAAITLPFLHISLLSTGLTSTDTQIAFALLVTLNVCALLVGHPHGR